MRQLFAASLALILLCPSLLPAAEDDPVQTLIDQAAVSVGEGDHDRAADLLERALRIEPRNAAIWHDLAQVRMHQGRYREAITLAERSDGFAGDNPGLRERNAHLVATAWQLAGDSGIARVAEQTPAQPVTRAPEASAHRPDDAGVRPEAGDRERNLASAPLQPLPDRSVPPPWYTPPPAFADPALAPSMDFVDLGLAVLSGLLGASALPSPGYGQYAPPADPYDYAPPPRQRSQSPELRFDLAPGLGVSIRLPAAMTESDPAAAALLNRFGDYLDRRGDAGYDSERAWRPGKHPKHRKYRHGKPHKNKSNRHRH